MRIVVTADPELPVPPHHYGGIERVVAMLVDGLVQRGHDVTLVAHRDSHVACRLIPYAAPTSRNIVDTARNMATVARALSARSADVVHSFGRLAYLLPVLPRRVPKLMSYQRAITPRSVRLAHALSGGSLQFSGCSRSVIAPVSAVGTWHVVYNGVPMDRYAFQRVVAPDAPLVFLGRIEHIKGPHIAIEVARAAQRRLIIAGNVPGEDVHQEYFRREIQPAIDGDNVVYAGPVDDEQKNRLLGQAAAMLMPILWDEPFGIVMAEALACGTPVVALRRGSVPEVVEHGVTGFVADSPDEMKQFISCLPAIDRGRCRAAAESKFSDRAIVEAYERLYRRVTRGDGRVDG